MMKVVSLVVGGIAATVFGTGCSGSSSALSPPSGGRSALATSAPPQTISVTVFRDLVRSHTASCIASGPDQSLWVTDPIDQDAGQSLIVRVSQAGKKSAKYG